MPYVINVRRFLPTPGFGPGGNEPRTGRERRPELPAGAMYVGRGTPLGNPYRRSEHGDAAIDLYRDWLREKVRRRDPAVMEQLRKIRENTALACSCAPRICHADVILEAWTRMRDSGRFGIVDDRDPEIAADVPWREPDPESDDLQWRMEIAVTELRTRGVNPDTWQRDALLRFYEEHCAGPVREQARRTAEAKHPMDDDT
jgi:hypothetical protein